MQRVPSPLSKLPEKAVSSTYRPSGRANSLGIMCVAPTFYPGTFVRNSHILPGDFCALPWRQRDTPNVTRLFAGKEELPEAVSARLEADFCQFFRIEGKFRPFSSDFLPVCRLGGARLRR